MWGRNDEILEPSYAGRFEATLPNCRLRWVEECGHCAHLEQPELAAAEILAFAGVEVAEPEVLSAKAAARSGSSSSSN